MHTYDVAIIGAGPSGSCLAYELSDLDVALFEKDEYPGKNNICAGGLNRLVLENIDIPQKIIEKEITLFRRFFGTKRIEYKIGTGGYVTVKRRIFDSFLAEKAEKKGADLFLNTKITKIDKEGDFWKLNDKYAAKIVVFANGPTAAIRRKFEIGFFPNPHNSYLGGIIELSSQDPPSILENYLSTDFVGHAWTFPKNDYINFGACLPLNEGKKIKNITDKMMKKYDIKGRFNAREKLRERYALIPIFLARNIVDKRGLVAIGDAAGFVSSSTGGGIRYGILSAKVASDAIREAIKKNNKEEVMKYEERIKKSDWYKKLKIENFVMSYLINNPPLYYHAFKSVVIFKSLYYNIFRRSNSHVEK